MNVTRWSPDTCECVLEYDWDPAAGEDDRVHTHHASVRTCPAHDGIGGPEHLNVVLRENQSKNRVEAHALELIPRLRVPTDDGAGYRRNPFVDFRWTFTRTGANRALTVELVGDGFALSAAEKGLLRAAVAQEAIPVTVK